MVDITFKQALAAFLRRIEVLALKVFRRHTRKGLPHQTEHQGRAGRVVQVNIMLKNRGQSRRVRAGRREVGRDLVIRQRQQLDRAGEPERRGRGPVVFRPAANADGEQAVIFAEPVERGDAGPDVFGSDLVEPVQQQRQAPFIQPPAAHLPRDLVPQCQFAGHPIRDRRLCLRPGREVEDDRDRGGRVLLGPRDRVPGQREEREGLAGAGAIHDEEGLVHGVEGIGDGNLWWQVRSGEQRDACYCYQGALHGSRLDALLQLDQRRPAHRGIQHPLRPEVLDLVEQDSAVAALPRLGLLVHADEDVAGDLADLHAGHFAALHLAYLLVHDDLGCPNSGRREGLAAVGAEA